MIASGQVQANEPPVLRLAVDHVRIGWIDGSVLAVTAEPDQKQDRDEDRSRSRRDRDCYSE